MGKTKETPVRALLLGSQVGSLPEEKALRKRVQVQPNDILIGVDRGAWYWKKWGYRPHLAIGDWDSLLEKKGCLKGMSSQTLSVDKDRSDLYFAVLAALKEGATELICYGVSGGRPDHQMSMLLDLSFFSEHKKVKKIEVHGVEADYIFLSSQMPHWTGKLGKGKTVSLFALSPRVSGIRLRGFAYPLSSGILKPSSYGLSNKTNLGKCEVHLRKGRLLVILPRDGVF